jgi:histidine triad (HIT) family protein
MDDCIFCKIIDRKISGLIIAETDEVIVLLSLENHPLVVPKKHIPNIYSLDSEIGSLVMEELVKTTNAVKRGLKCEGVYITQANEPAAGQDVFHIHFHIYPRWQGQIMNQTEVVSDAERIKTLDIIKSAFVQLN